MELLIVIIFRLTIKKKSKILMEPKDSYYQLVYLIKIPQSVITDRWCVTTIWIFWIFGFYGFFELSGFMGYLSF